MITLQKFSMEPTKQHIYINDSNEPNLTKGYITKIQKNNGSEVVSDYGQDTNWTKSPEDKRRLHVPAQAKPEGFPS